MIGTIISCFCSAKWVRALAIAVGATLCIAVFNGLARTAELSAAAGGLAVDNDEAKKAIQETGQAALNNVQVLWQRIDERRLKNRTRDELVAWVIMGLLVGGLFYRLGAHNQITSVVLGLVGAFIGGIAAHVAQLSLGLGPVLITYEDLLCTFLGGVLILCGTRWRSLMKWLKPRGR